MAGEKERETIVSKVYRQRQIDRKRERERWGERVKKKGG